MRSKNIQPRKIALKDIVENTNVSGKGCCDLKRLIAQQVNAIYSSPNDEFTLEA